MQPFRTASLSLLHFATLLVAALLLTPAAFAQPQPARPTTAVRPTVPVRPTTAVRPTTPARPGRNTAVLPSVMPPGTAGVVPGVPVIPGTGPGQVVTPTPNTTGVIDSAATAAGPGAHLNEFDPGIEFQPLPPGARITFNLQDADLPDLIRAVGNITGRRFILPGKVRSIKTTIYSPTKVTPGEAYQAFLSVLEVNGMTVVPSGRYLKVIETAGAATQVLPTYGSGQEASTDDRYITRIVRLRNISPEDASTVLGHFKSRDGDITAYASTQTLIITDTGANIRRMIRILGDIDVPSVGEQVWVEPVHYAVASELSARIQEILGGGATASASRAPGAPAPSPDSRLGRIMADDRSNSMIIVATQRMYLRVLELLRRLDVSIEGEGQVHVLRLQHGDSEEMATTLNAITNGGRQGGGSASQNRGTNAVFEGAVRITAAKSNNALVITSSPRDYASLRRVIDDLDNPRRQVFIEAVVMELQINRSSKLGLNFHGALPVDVAGEQSIALGGFNALNSILLNQDALSGLALGIRGPNLSSSQNLLPGIGISIPEFGVTLNALASSGDADVLSTPHIIATDNSPADINVGQNVPLQTNIGGGLGAAGGAAGALGALGGLGGLGAGFAAPRQDVGTKIHLVPHINDSNEVRLDIDEEISEVGAGGGGTLGAVTINRRTAKTTVVVQDQTTIVIGGLIRNTEVNEETRIPILGDIPILGALFRNTSHRTQRSNLLLFLTPYVIRDQGDLRRIFERKMRERQEFLDRYLVFGDNGYQSHTDYSRTNGIVEEVRQSMRTLRTRAQFEADSRPRRPPEHMPSESIELPPEARSSGASQGSTPVPGLAAPAAVVVDGMQPQLSAPMFPAAIPVGIPVPP